MKASSGRAFNDAAVSHDIGAPDVALIVKTKKYPFSHFRLRTDGPSERLQGREVGGAEFENADDSRGLTRTRSIPINSTPHPCPELSRLQEWQVSPSACSSCFVRKRSQALTQLIAVEGIENIGGSGRARTFNQTVMSAVPYRKNRANSVIPDQDRARSCAFVHGVSAG